jgi:hypothetical protein
MTNLQEFIEDRIFDIKYSFSDIKYWIAHRTYDKYHVVRTGLPVGYSDTVEKMLHANFTMLIDFIEVEKAWMNHICHKTPHPFPWWQRKFRKFRSAPDGLDYLYWECHLDVSAVGHSQREAAIEQRELYRWWTDIRLNRDDPDEVSGWKALFESRGDAIPFADGPRLNKEMMKALKISSKIEARYAKEDEAMLIRLMKIRLSLWT